MGIRAAAFACIAVLSLFSCAKEEQPVPPKPAQRERLTVIRPKRPSMTPEQRASLRFPEKMIAEIEAAAGAEAEPFFETITGSSENLRGEKGIERQRLSGFSVRTAKADEVLATYGRSLRIKGYLLFRSQQNYGKVPDVLTVIKGGNSYDILRVQKTEAPSDKLDTKAIIAWLRERQKDAPFVITGAGQDFVEAQFVKQPANMKGFARKVAAFSPDVLRESHSTVEKLAERMKRTNGFRLVWD